MTLQLTSQLEYSTLSHPLEAQRLGQILSQCFNGSPNDWPYYLNTIGQENFRVIHRSGEILGGLAILQMGQWFGSQAVPMAGIASVGVPPEYRGTGVAAELLTGMLKELQAKEVPLSALYAATQGPYRKVGYEQAGTSCHWELPLKTIDLGFDKASMRELRALPMQAVVPLRQEIFHPLYQQWAIQHNGNLNRHPVMWKLLIEPNMEEAIYAYLIGSQTQPEGYVIFSQGREQQLLIRDLVVLTPAAGRRLWVFLADHRSMFQTVRWRSCSLDPLLLLLSEQTDQIHRLERWLLRIVDVSKALERRGYPAQIEAELHIEIQDHVLLENNGKFVLNVSRGLGEVTRGGRGDLQLDIRGLAPLYTGLFTPDQLQRAGQISGTHEALAVAAQIFTGSEPWMSDRF
jgi:predicted acetyltransferase